MHCCVLVLVWITRVRPGSRVSRDVRGLRAVRGGVAAGHQRGVGAERGQPSADEDQDGVTRFQTI